MQGRPNDQGPPPKKKGKKKENKEKEKAGEYLYYFGRKSGD